MQEAKSVAYWPQAQVQAASFPEQEHLKCPRCDSGNTKFCYYNNYNLSQPRHFCKSCRRYWTKGGTLRNIPVGGGSRKNNAKRPSPSGSSSPASSAKRHQPFSGSFGSLLGSAEGHFGNFLDHGMGRPNEGWPDLSMYTPPGSSSSTFL